MAKLTVDQLIQLSEQLFVQQEPMKTLWQTLADHFYPERADFTTTKTVGDEMASGLLDSYPVLARRDLGNAIGAMLRSGSDWFRMGVNRETSHDGDAWLEWATKKQMKLMHERSSNFHRATREGDHDFVTFGQPVISVELNKKRDGFLYRCWHLRDCAWWEDEAGKVCGVIRKWSPTYRDLISVFSKDRVHECVNRDVMKTPFKTVNVRHIFMPAYMYGDEEIINKEFEFVSIFIDIDNRHILEEKGMKHRYYIVPRFFTVSGNPYAYSPAAIAALPHSRLLQSMTFTIMEAAERATRPPLIAQRNVIRGDVDLSPSGITYVDEEYDERLGESLRPLTQNMGGLPFGMEMKRDVISLLASAFFLDKLNLPQTDHQMTAYEVEQRMKQFRREALPLIAPAEAEYNGQLCELTFEIGMAAGFFGTPDSIPQELQGEDMVFSFRSPLSDIDGEMQAQQFMQMAQALQAATAYDKQVVDNVDMDQAFRGAVESVPKSWLHDPQKVMVIRQMQAAAIQAGGAPGVEINE